MSARNGDAWEKGFYLQLRRRCVSHTLSHTRMHTFTHALDLIYICAEKRTCFPGRRKMMWHDQSTWPLLVIARGSHPSGCAQCPVAGTQGFTLNAILVYKYDSVCIGYVCSPWNSSVAKAAKVSDDAFQETLVRAAPNSTHAGRWVYANSTNAEANAVHAS